MFRMFRMHASRRRCRSSVTLGDRLTGLASCLVICVLVKVTPFNFYGNRPNTAQIASPRPARQRSTLAITTSDHEDRARAVAVPAWSAGRAGVAGGAHELLDDRLVADAAGFG